MRFMPALALILALTGCDLVEDPNAQKAVDANHLPPLSARETALLVGADGAMQQGNYAAAERDYMTAVAESKGRVDAHLSLARLYAKQHNDAKEREILNRALALQPNEPLANYLMGKLELDDNHYNEAIAAFERGRISRPDDIDLSTGQAVANDMLGKHGAAQMLYIRTMKQNPNADLANLRTDLAMSYLLTGDAKKALAILKEDAKKPNASPVTRHNMALAYGLLGKNSEAKAILNGDIDEETRLLALARLKEYIKNREDDVNTPPLQPAINETVKPIEPVSQPVIKKSPTPSAKK